jgi:murein L,D-transpeptidase YafK
MLWLARIISRRVIGNYFRLSRCLLAAGITVICSLSVWALGSLLAGRSAMAEARSPQPLRPLTSPKVVIVKHRRLLHLFDGRRLVKSYRIGLGKEPAGDKVTAADERTPSGQFYICSRNPHSCYHRFLGLSYPNDRAIERGLGECRISRGEAEALRRALREGRQPDWTTALGGGIGLHGGGSDYDWTAGCIALTDASIEELDQVLHLGDPVVILP